VTSELGAALRGAGIEGTVGNTPLVELRHLSPAPGVRLFAKLESENPTGSVKDRVALAMLDAAEQSGELRRGRTVLEPSSGNTGIALAALGRVRGYPVRIVLPESATAERVALLEAFGATLIRSPGELGSNGAVALARQLAADDGSLFMPFQYANPANPGVHYRTTGVEILEECPDVDAFVAGLGTGGTLMGVGRRLREANPDVQIIAAEPLAGDDVSGLRSLEDGYVPEVLDVSKLDRKLLVSNAEAVRGLRLLARKEGIFAGVSAGGVLHVALKVAAEIEAPANIVMLFADGGWKYLSAGLWDRDEDDLAGEMESKVWW
jgi:[CysO sulfur-carrier protein]-thiocarboxylate-dependent cysteine synthase